MLTFEMKSCVFQTTIQYVTSVPASASAFLSSSFPQKQTHVQTTTMKAFKYEIIVASFRALVSQFPGKKNETRDVSLWHYSTFYLSRRGKISGILCFLSQGNSTKVYGLSLYVKLTRCYKQYTWTQQRMELTLSALMFDKFLVFKLFTRSCQNFLIQHATWLRISWMLRLHFRISLLIYLF